MKDAREVAQYAETVRLPKPVPIRLCRHCGMFIRRRGVLRRWRHSWRAWDWHCPELRLYREVGGYVRVLMAVRCIDGQGVTNAAG